MSKSKDLREAAVAYKKAGNSYEDTGKVFGVSASTVHRWVRQYEETGDLSNKPLNRSFKKIDPEKLKAYVAEHPDDTQQEVATVFGCCNQALSQAYRRLGITRKKKTLRYTEQSEEKVKEYNKEIKDIPKEKIAYVDETGIDKCLYREYGYALRGQKVYDKISGKKFQRTSIVAAKLGKRIIAPMQYSGTMNSALFELWFEKCLLPCLEKGATIVMDNASFHRKKQLYEICRKCGFNLIFLPPYSPELNPIEKYWFVLKHRIKAFLRMNISLDDAIQYVF